MRRSISHPRDQSAFEDLWRDACALVDAGEARKGFELMGRAARAGFASAQNNLGYFYDVGLGTRKNSVRALHWYRRAVAQGSPFAANNIATIYVARNDLRRGLHWYKRAADLGDDDAWLDVAKVEIQRSSDYRSALPYLRRAIASKFVTPEVRREARNLMKELGRSS